MGIPRENIVAGLFLSRPPKEGGSTDGAEVGVEKPRVVVRGGGAWNWCSHGCRVSSFGLSWSVKVVAA